MMELLKRARIGAIAVSIAASALPASAAVCTLPHERSAMQVRILQSDLMVAALSCDARERYNSFVRKFEPELVSQGRALRSYFRRAHGGAGKARLSDYVTTLANEASKRRLAAGRTYCGVAARLFDLVLGLRSTELASFSAARDVASENEAPPCPVKAAGRDAAER